MGMSGRVYLGGAVALGAALLYFGMRLAFLNLPLVAGQSNTRANIIYLPLLLAQMIGQFNLTSLA